jgi:hypothetical protein
MTYQFDIRPASKSLFNWSKTFSCLSTQQFGLVYDYLDFPIRPSDELRQLARDFSIAFYANINRKRPELPGINLLEGVSPFDTWENRIKALFTNTFNRLENMGYAKMIYQWETLTSDYYGWSNQQSLNDFCRLIRVWTVFEWLKQPISSEHELYSSDWNRTITRLAPIYAPNENWKIVPMNISTETSTKLQIIVIQHETRHMLFSGTLNQIELSPKSDWEEFAFDRIWTGLEGNFHINLQEWKKIAATLSDDDISLLEQWALQHKDHYRDLKFPLPD